MSFLWIYDLPNWLLGLLTVLVVTGLSAAGLVAARPHVRRVFGPPPGHNDVVSYYLGAFGVFYGLTIGLVAVASWQNLADLDGLVNEEASALRVLDRAVVLYPEPARSKLHRLPLVYVFLIAAMDHPFRGEFSVGPDAFRALRQQMPATTDERLVQPVEDALLVEGAGEGLAMPAGAFGRGEAQQRLARRGDRVQERLGAGGGRVALGRRQQGGAGDPPGDAGHLEPGQGREDVEGGVHAVRHRPLLQELPAQVRTGLRPRR
jgi:hypothetical protein